MNEDDTETNFKFYRVAYSHDRTGWCVFQQANGGNLNQLLYVDGPWDTEQEATIIMRELNKEQGLDFNGVK